MSCACKSPITVKANFLAGVRNERFEDSDYLVVPVVMLRQTVVNGAFVKVDELQPEAWNGVPVTVQHPTENGAPISANSPKVLAKFAIGQIFNARMDGDKLCAEAWIDTAKAKKRGFANILSLLQSAVQMDVSTGYFCKQESLTGQFNGKDFSEAHTDLKPDHLALLPNAEGACNWNDGCGIRANQKEGFFMQFKQQFVALAKAMGFSVNEESPMDKKQMVDLLINKKVATEGDRESLMALNETLLGNMVANAKPPFPTKEDKADGGADDAEENADGTKKKAPPKANQQQVVVHAQLNDEDKAALAFARNQFAGHKSSLIARITANSTMKADALEKMDVATLETIANGLPQQFDFSGRASPFTHANEADKDEVESMTTNGVVANINQQKAAKGGN